MSRPIVKAVAQGLWFGVGFCSFIACFVLVFIAATGGF